MRAVSSVVKTTLQGLTVRDCMDVLSESSVRRVKNTEYHTKTKNIMASGKRDCGGLNLVFVYLF